MTKTDKRYTRHSNSKALILKVQYVRFLLKDIQKLSTECEGITVLTLLYNVAETSTKAQSGRP